MVSIEHLRRVWHADRGSLLLRTPGQVPLGLAYVLLVETNPFSELVIFPDYALRISLGTFWILLLLLVVFFINVDLAIFQPYLDLEAGENQSILLYHSSVHAIPSTQNQGSVTCLLEHVWHNVLAYSKCVPKVTFISYMVYITSVMYIYMRNDCTSIGCKIVLSLF